MTNIPENWPIEEYIDVCSQRYWERAGQTSDAMTNLQLVPRDNSRTPMQWNDEAQSGLWAVAGVQDSSMGCHSRAVDRAIQAACYLRHGARVAAVASVP